MKRREHPGGFTLIELLLVVVIIGILAAIVVPRLAGRTSEAQIAAATADLKVLREALERFELDNGTYPSSEQGLEALVIKPNPEPKKWKGPYIQAKAVPTDPWGNRYDYLFPSATNAEMYDLSCVGKDGQPGNEDDIDAFGATQGQGTPSTPPR